MRAFGILPKPFECVCALSQALHCPSNWCLSLVPVRKVVYLIKSTKKEDCEVGEESVIAKEVTHSQSLRLIPNQDAGMVRTASHWRTHSALRCVACLCKQSANRPTRKLLPFTAPSIIELERLPMHPLQKGLLRELNPGPLAPKARIIPLDQAAN